MKNLFIQILICSFILLLIQCQSRNHEEEMLTLQNHFYPQLHHRFPLFSFFRLTDVKIGTGSPNEDPINKSFLSIPDTTSIRIDSSFLENYQDSLLQIDTLQLSDTSLLAFRQMNQTLEKIKMEWLNQIMNRHRADFHNLRKVILPILNHDDLPIDQKMSIILKNIQQAPAYYQAAQQYVHESPSANLELAIEEHIETYQFLSSTLLDSLNKSSPAENERLVFEQHLAKAQISIKEYIAFCNSRKFEFNQQLLREEQGEQ